jgi:non-homologous end joining protein Ku
MAAGAIWKGTVSFGLVNIIPFTVTQTQASAQKHLFKRRGN